MSVSEQVVLNLVVSIVSIAATVVCADCANPSPKSIAGALRWASVTILVSSAGLLVWGMWTNYRQSALRSRESYAEPGSEIEVPAGEGLERGVEIQARVVLYTEIAITSMWMHVYGWGLLLFVSLYCLSGIDSVSTCWWILGMTSLVMDELITSGVAKVWVVVLIIGFSVCSTILWFLERGDLYYTDSRGDFELGYFELGNFCLGVVGPLICPFVFFSQRSTARAASVWDVSKLSWMATPFMVVLALCALEGTMHEACPGRRIHHAKFGVHIGNATETAAHFHPGAHLVAADLDQARYATEGKAKEPLLSGLCLVLSPFAAVLVLRQLTLSVMEGFTTEFMDALLLVLTVRHCVTHDYSAGSIVGVIVAGLCLCLIVCTRRP